MKKIYNPKPAIQDVINKILPDVQHLARVFLLESLYSFNRNTQKILKRIDIATIEDKKFYIISPHFFHNKEKFFSIIISGSELKEKIIAVETGEYHAKIIEDEYCAKVYLAANNNPFCLVFWRLNCEPENIFVGTFLNNGNAPEITGSHNVLAFISYNVSNLDNVFHQQLFSGIYPKKINDPVGWLTNGEERVFKVLIEDVEFDSYRDAELYLEVN